MKWDVMMDGNFIYQNIAGLDFSGWVGFCFRGCVWFLHSIYFDVKYLQRKIFLFYSVW